MIAPVIYLLCVATALGCGALLLRQFGRSQQRLLLWAGLCFVGLALANGLVAVDLLVLTQEDLFTLRNVVTLASLCLFAFGLIWDAA